MMKERVRVRKKIPCLVDPNSLRLYFIPILYQECTALLDVSRHLDPLLGLRPH